MACVIIGAGLLGTATPVPGGGVVAAAPIIGCAELYLKLRSMTATGKDFQDFLTRMGSTSAASACVYLATPDTAASFARKSLRKIYVVDDSAAVRPAKTLAASQGIEVVPTDALRGGNGKDFDERSRSFIEAVQEEAESAGDTRATLLIGHADHLGQKSACPGAYLRFEGRGGQWQAKAFRVKAWDEDKHPRGQPGNAGQFGPSAEGSGQSGGSTKPEPARQESLPVNPDSPTRQTSGDTAIAERREASSKTPATAADRSPVHKTLEQSSVKRSDRLRASTSETHLLTLEDGTQAVFKPMKGESKDPRAGRRGVPPGTQYKREIAASRIAEVLDFADLVPTTTVRSQGGDIGSAQVYVANANEAADAAEPYDGEKDAARAAAFDYLIGHLDRHEHNWLEPMVLIDNGLAFPTHYDGRDFFNMRIMRHAARKRLPLPDLTGLKDRWPKVEKELQAVGLEPDAIDLTRQRFEALTSGKFKLLAQLPSLLLPKGTLAQMTSHDRQAQTEWRPRRRETDRES